MLRLLAVALLFMTTPLHAQTAPFAARELAPGIHLLATPPDYLGPAISNVTIIEQADGFVLIDTGATLGHGRAIVAYLRSISAKPVKAVVFTHWHNDHPLGIGAIREAWPHARIIATAATRAGIAGPAATSVGPRPDERHETSILNQISDSLAQIAALRRNPTNTDAQRERFDRMAQEMRAFGQSFRGTYYILPDETLTRERLLDDAERPVRLMFLGRANTAGDTVAWLPRQRIVVTGDIVVSPVPFGFYSYPESWIAVLQRLKGIGFALLVPGHGEPMQDSAYLDRLIGTISDIRAQVGPLARQGLSLDDVRGRVDFTAQTEIFGTTPRLRSGFQSLWLAPMVENAWREARGVEIVQGGGEATVTNSRRRAVR